MIRFSDYVSDNYIFEDFSEKMKTIIPTNTLEEIKKELLNVGYDITNVEFSHTFDWVDVPSNSKLVIAYGKKYYQGWAAFEGTDSNEEEIASSKSFNKYTFSDTISRTLYYFYAKNAVKGAVTKKQPSVDKEHEELLKETWKALKNSITKANDMLKALSVNGVNSSKDDIKKAYKYLYTMQSIIDDFSKNDTSYNLVLRTTINNLK